MTAYAFYKWFALIIEASIAIPVLVAVKQWKILPPALKLAATLLMSQFVFYLIQDVFLYFGRSNLFLYYFFSIASHTLSCLFFIRVLKSKTEKRLVSLLLVLGYGLLLSDYQSVALKSINYVSSILLSILVFLLSLYSLYRYSAKFSPPLLYILIGLALQFLLWAINLLANELFLQSQSYAILWLNEKIIFYYLLLGVFALYTFAFYSHEKK